MNTEVKRIDYTSTEVSKVYTLWEDGVYLYEDVELSIAPSTFKEGILYIPMKVSRNWEACQDTKIELLYGNLLWKNDALKEYRYEMYDIEGRIGARAGAFSVTLHPTQQRILAQEAISSYILRNDTEGSKGGANKGIGETVTCDIFYKIEHGKSPLVRINVKKVNTKDVGLSISTKETQRKLLKQYAMPIATENVSDQGVYWVKTHTWIPIGEALQATEINRVCYTWYGRIKTNNQPVIYTGIVGDTPDFPKRSLAKRIQEHIDDHPDIEIISCMYEALYMCPDNYLAVELLRACETRLQSLLAALLPCEGSSVVPLLPSFLEQKNNLPIILNSQFNYHTS